MSTSLTRSAVSVSFPRLARLMSNERRAERVEELARFGIGQLHQIERDLDQFYLTTRYADALAEGVIDEASDPDARPALDDATSIVMAVRSGLTSLP